MNWLGGLHCWHANINSQRHWICQCQRQFLPLKLRQLLPLPHHDTYMSATYISSLAPGCAPGLHCNEALKCSEMNKDKCNKSTTRNRQRRRTLGLWLSQWPKLRRKQHKDNAPRKSVGCGKLCSRCHCCGFGHSVCCCNKAVSGQTSKLLWILVLLLLQLLLLLLLLPLSKYALCTQQLKQTLRDSLGWSVRRSVGQLVSWFVGWLVDAPRRM